MRLGVAHSGGAVVGEREHGLGGGDVGCTRVFMIVIILCRICTYSSRKCVYMYMYVYSAHTMLLF